MSRERIYKYKFMAKPTYKIKHRKLKSGKPKMKRCRTNFPSLGRRPKNKPKPILIEIVDKLPVIQQEQQSIIEVPII